MDKELWLKFAATLSKLEGRDYLEAMIAFAAAPTIQCKKPSSLMSFTSYGKNKAVLWNLYGAEICENFQVKFFVLKANKDVLTVLIYRRSLLEWHVNHRRNQPFLRRMGYDSEGVLEQKLETLRQRFEALCPHEVRLYRFNHSADISLRFATQPRRSWPTAGLAPALPLKRVYDVQRAWVLLLTQMVACFHRDNGPHRAGMATLSHRILQGEIGVEWPCEQWARG